MVRANTSTLSPDLHVITQSGMWYAVFWIERGDQDSGRGRTQADRAQMGHRRARLQSQMRFAFHITAERIYDTDHLEQFRPFDRIETARYHVGCSHYQNNPDPDSSRIVVFATD